MDEEELEQPKKITIGNFFESIKSIDKVANRALKTSKSNLGIIQEQKSIINNLSTLIEGMQSDIQEINNYIIVEKNEREDKLFEEQDKKQKEEMRERAEALKGEKGDQGAQGTQGTQGEQGEGLSPSLGKGGGGLKTLLASVGILGATKLMGFLRNPLGLKKSLLPGGNNSAEDIEKRSKLIGEDKPRGLTGMFGGLADAFTGNKFDFDKRGGKKEDIKNDLKDEIKSEIKQELNLKEDKKSGLSNFVDKAKKKISNFDGTPGSRETKDKPQEVNATNPESSTFSQEIQYTGKLGPGLKFIVDESSLEPGVTPERAEQHFYKERINILEDDFREDIMRGGMTREQAIEAYGPQSNLYRFKENYNNTLEFGGYELDVGKHYDSIKNSYSKGNKKKDKESPLKGEKRGFKGVVGGVADSLTGGVFDFDKRGDSKIQRVGKGFIDALSGNILDLDKKGGKPSGVMRNLTGMADFFTADMFDLDKRGKMDLFDIRKRMENKKKKEAYQNNPHVQEFNEDKNELYDYKSKIPMNTTVNPDGSITSKGSGELLGDEPFTPGQPLTEKQKMVVKMGIDMGNTFSPEIMESYNMETIKPIIESNEKDLSSTIIQSVDANNQAIQVLNAQNQINNQINNPIPPNNNPSPLIQASPPQVADAEIKATEAPIPFRKLLSSKKYLSITSNSKSGLPPEIASMIS